MFVYMYIYVCKYACGQTPRAKTCCAISERRVRSQFSRIAAGGWQMSVNGTPMAVGTGNSAN